MQSNWQKSLMASMITATILGGGAIVIWTLFVTATTAVSEPSGPNLSRQFALTLYLLSPVLLSGARLFFSEATPAIGSTYIEYFRVYWVSFAILGVISSALAVTVYVHHRRYGRVLAAAWFAYVLLMGVPGAIGYWLHRRWPPSVRCPRCDLASPCDREECLHCGARFPLPTTDGTEILQPT